MSDIVQGADAPVGIWRRYKALWLSLGITGGVLITVTAAIVVIALLGAIVIWMRFMGSYG